MVNLKDKSILFATWSCHNKNWHAYQMWDGPIRKIFGRVVTFDPQETYYKYGREELNKKFLDVVAKEKPDYIFLWIMHWEFKFETLSKIRQISPKSKIVEFSGDDDIKFEDHTLELFPFVDYFLLTQPQYFEHYRKAGKKFYFSCGADIEEFKYLRNTKKKYDISFVGTPKSDRVDFMRSLLDKGFKMKVCGAGWDKYPEFKKVYGGKIPVEEFVKLINETKVNICLSKNIFNGPHLLERFFEVNACNAFQVTEYCEGYFPMFKEEYNIVTFKNEGELLDKIEYYLKHEKERKKIALRAYRKTINNYSIEKLLKKAFEDMERDKNIGKKTEKYCPEDERDIIYLSKEDIELPIDLLRTKIKKHKYVCFKDKSYEILPYKNFLQLHSMKNTKKEICCVDSYRNSLLIGDYAVICSKGILEYFGENALNKNIDLAQLMIKKEYFLKNIKKFRRFLVKKNNILNRKNTAFISFPLLRTRKISKMASDREGIYFAEFEGRLLNLKNQKRILRDPYTYKLIIYALFFNKSLLKYILRNTIKKSKNKNLIRIAGILRILS